MHKTVVKKLKELTVPESGGQDIQIYVLSLRLYILLLVNHHTKYLCRTIACIDYNISLPCVRDRLPFCVSFPLILPFYPFTGNTCTGNRAVVVLRHLTIRQNIYLAF